MRFKSKEFTTLVVSIIVSTLILFVSLSLFANSSYLRAKSDCIDQVETDATHAQDSLAHIITQSSSVLKVISRCLDNMINEGKSLEEIEQYLVTETSHNEFSSSYTLQNVYAYIDGNYIDGSGWTPYAGFVPTDRPWYKMAKSANSNNVGLCSYIDVVTDTPVISISSQLYNPRNVVSMDISLDDLLELMSPHQSLDYIFIFDNTGTVMATNKPNYLGLNFFLVDYLDTDESLMLQKAISNHYQTFKTNFKGKNCYVFSRGLDIGMTLVYIQNSSNLLRTAKLYLVRYYMLIVTILIVVILTFVNTYRYKMKAIRAEKARNSFLTNISHELRDPINTILGTNEIIAKETQEESVKHHLASVHSTSQYLLQIVNDLIDYSMIQSGNLDILPSDYKVATLINDIIQVYEPRAKEKNLQLLVEVDNKLPSVLNGDANRIKQIILNLLSNAIKFTKKGSITIRLNHWKIRDGRIILHIEVEDTGIGIMPTSLNKIFTAFQQSSDESKVKRGTGLGLTITRSITLLMDGRLWVDSTYGRGSCFFVEIPQKIVKHVPIQNADIITKRRDFIEKAFIVPDAKILVVDDVAMNLKVFSSLLKKTKIQIDTATSGADALTMVEGKHYDIIFLDHMMPDMDGVETMEAMKALPNNKNSETPIVVVTANVMNGCKAEYVALGFTDYLSKPVKYELIESILKKYLPKELLP